MTIHIPATAFWCDAVTKKADPTGTLDIRKRLSSMLAMRFRKVLGLVRTNVVENDVLGLKPASISPLALAGASGNREIGFQTWLDNLLRAGVSEDGQWMRPMLALSYSRAVRRAQRLTRSVAVPRDMAETIDVLTTLAFTELQGICEAVSQRCLRAAATGWLHNAKPIEAFNEMRHAIDAVGVVRSGAMAQLMVVKSFTAGTLDTFVAVGVKQVGLIPETLQTKRPTKDAYSKNFGFEGAGSRMSREVQPSSSTIYRITKQEENLEEDLSAEGDTVEVATAGDNDVCPECDDIEGNNPYSIDEARSLIPAHPNCRCAFVPVDDGSGWFGAVTSFIGRFFESATIFDMNENHDPKTGQFAEGTGPAAEKAVVAVKVEPPTAPGRDTPVPKYEPEVKKETNYLDGKLTRHDFEAVATKEVSIASLKSPQRDYERRKVDMLKSMWDHNVLNTDPIYVLNMPSGNQVIWGGNHRVIAASELGHKTIPAKVITISAGEYKDRARVDDSWRHEDYNENHDPKTGQFSEGSGSVGAPGKGDVHTSSSGLTLGEKKAVEHYTEINQELDAYLRDPRGFAQKNPGRMADIRNTMRDLNSAIGKSRTTENLRVHSGVSDWSRIASFKEGDKYTPQRFISASTDKSIAKVFSGGSKGGLLTLDLPKGTNAVQPHLFTTINGNIVTGDPHPNNPDAEHYLREVVLGSPQQYTVVSVGPNSMHVRAIPSSTKDWADYNENHDPDTGRFSEGEGIGGGGGGGGEGGGGGGGGGERKTDLPMSSKYAQEKGNLGPLVSAVEKAQANNTIEERNVKLSELRATQSYLGGDGGGEPVFDGLEDKPVIADNGVEKLILDGHHRISSAIASGKTKMSVYYVNTKKRRVSDYNENHDPKTGEFSEGSGVAMSGGKPISVTGSNGVQKYKVGVVRDALKLLPQDHLDVFKGEIILTNKDIERNAKIMGQFKLSDHSITLNTEFVSSIEETLLHEMGHAHDVSVPRVGGLTPSMALHKDAWAEAHGMTGAETKAAQYWLKSSPELYAEMYSLAFSRDRGIARGGSRPARFFGGMTRGRALSIFPKSVKSIRG